MNARSFRPSPPPAPLLPRAHTPQATVVTADGRGMVTCGVDVSLVEGFPVGGLDVISSQSPHPQPSICDTLALLHCDSVKTDV